MQELVDIVIEKNGVPITTSLKVAEKFEKSHDNVLKAIRILENSLVNFDEPNFSAEKSATKFFRETTYKNRGKKYPMYEMDRDGFSLLVMGFTGEKALDWKVKYIKAFNKMEEMLKERSTPLWMEQRVKGKLTRDVETNVIKQLISYAKEQGSTHADMLYITYSKLANKMTGVSDRNLATFQQLNELSFIENIILNQIRIGMDQGLPYKDIYQTCKRRIEQFQEIAYLTAVSRDSLSDSSFMRKEQRAKEFKRSPQGSGHDTKRGSRVSWNK